MNSSKRLAISFLPLAVSFLLSSSLAARQDEHPASQAPERRQTGPARRLDAANLRQSRGQGRSHLHRAVRSEGMARSTVPTTVVAALVKDKTFTDPLFGMNLRDFAGVNYPIGANFSNIPMAPDSPYTVSWWYRKQFAMPARIKGKTVWLNFEGINYRANIWLNGKQIANSDDVAGAWRTYEFNVTGAASPARRMCSQYRSSRPPKTISPSLSSTGIPRRPTKTWDCGAKFI